MILSDCADGQLDVEASDSRSVATTLTIHEIQRQSRVRMAAAGRAAELPPPVSEILDGRTATLFGQYHDHLVRRGSGWRIAERRQFMNGSDAGFTVAIHPLSRRPPPPGWTPPDMAGR
jgi:hypothetical protein